MTSSVPKSPSPSKYLRGKLTKGHLLQPSLSHVLHWHIRVAQQGATIEVGQRLVVLGSTIGGQRFLKMPLCRDYCSIDSRKVPLIIISYNAYIRELVGAYNVDCVVNRIGEEVI